MTAQSLTQTLQKSVFTQQVQYGELDCIQVRHPFFSADLLLQGAHLLSFKPNDKNDWLWLSETAEFRKGVSVRGGIPVCWPWFGNPDRNPDKVQEFILDPHSAPAHGIARAVDWQLTAVNESSDAVELTLELPEVDSQVWSGGATAKIVFTFTKSGLTVNLITLAGDQAVSFSQALHTYFPTSDISATRVQGFHGFAYVDALDDWSEKQQRGDIHFSEETDRIYTAGPLQTLVTPEQTLELNCNSASAVVWNPWVEKSKRLSQFPHDAWQRMFCVESANALHDYVTLQPNESHSLTLSLRQR